MKIKKHVYPKKTTRANEEECSECGEMTEDQAAELLNSINDLALDRRKIYIFAPIDPTVSGTVISAIHFMEDVSDDDIEIIINSPGGAVVDCWAICDAMDSSPCDFVTKTYGFAASAACLIATNGTPGKRYSGKNSEFMFHEVYGPIEDMRASTAREIVKDSIHYQKKFTKIFSRNTGMTPKEIDKEFYAVTKDKFISAKEAKKFGMIDHILPVKRKTVKKDGKDEEDSLTEE